MEAEDEIRDLKNKILLNILIFIIFFIPAVIIFTTKFGRVETDLINKLNKEEKFLILFTKEECSYCNNAKIILKNNNIIFEEIKTDSERYYDTIIHKLEISKKDIVEPTLMYIEDGKQISNLVNINDEDDIILYLEYNNLLLDE